MAILSNTLTDVKEKIGTALLPVISQFMGMITSVALPVIQKFSDWFANTAVTSIQTFMTKLKPVGEIFTQLKNLANTMGDDVRTVFFYLAKALEPVTEKLAGVGKGFISIRGDVNTVKGVIDNLASGFDKVTDNISRFLSHVNIKPLVDQVSSDLAKINLKPIEDALGSFGKLVSDALSHINFSMIITDVKSVAQIFLNLSPASNLIQALSSHAKELGNWFQTSVVPALKAAEPGFKNLMQAIQGLFPAMVQISNIIHDYLQKAFNDLLPIFMKVIPIVIQISGIIANMLGAAIKFLTPYVVQATAAVGQFASDIIQRVSPILLQFFNNIQVGLNWLQKYWPQIWGTIAPFLQAVWDDITGIVKIAWALLTGIINIGLDLLSGNWSQAWTDMKNMLGGIWSGIKDIIKGGINGMIGVLNLGIDALNGFVDAVENALNAAARALGMGSPIPVTTIPLIPAYADGTPDGGHPGGAALVGERGPEIALLPKGTSVIPANLSKQMLSGVPAYADGTNNILQNMMNWVSGGAQSLLNNILKGLNLHFNLGEASGIAGGITNDLKKWALDWITKTLMPKLPTGGGSGGTAGPGQAVNIPGNLASWIMAAIGLTGVPSSWANDLGIIAMHESGGNPSAINNWDSNAQAGHPSQGIMQTIPSTFAAHMVSGHTNILNPIDNIAAAIGYIKGRYGSVFNVPGIVSMSNGGAYQGYADGTNFAPGGMAWVGERGKELMYIPRGAQIVPHEALTRGSQQPPIVVHPPAIYLDGRVIANNQLPYLIEAIRYNVGTYNI